MLDGKFPIGRQGGQAERNRLEVGDKGVIAVLVAALEAARQAIPYDDYFRVQPKIDAALRLARGAR